MQFIKRGFIESWKPLRTTSVPLVYYFFKGGTCASMLGWLNRFSVDPDFDYAGDEKDVEQTRKALERLFTSLGLSVKDKSKNGIQYF